ncbi:MAG: DNA mismatch repair endonuclease MutL [Planctomycetota bacterium]
MNAATPPTVDSTPLHSAATRPIIRQLPPNLVNQIAAGEVIERPASVVKELIENAIDARASRIEVTIEGGGSELIRVADNGCGMSADQLPLAITSHATSKLPTDEALFSVGTLGFRGEALASIGSVSQMTIRSRSGEDDAGNELFVRGGVAEPVAPCASPVGTVMEIRNLFFNTPVRHKFLKTANTERGHITEAFTRLSLANPHVDFVLRNGSRIIYDLPATQRWSERIAAFFGDEVAENLITIRGTDDPISIHGYVCDPSVSRGNNRMQYLFLNGRHIRDRSLQHALGEAYRGLLMVGRFPVCFLQLRMSPEMVDVNVHPTKLEVRFTDSGRVYARLLQTLRHQFLKTDMTHRVGNAPTPPAGSGAEVSLNAVPQGGRVSSGPVSSGAASSGEATMTSDSVRRMDGPASGMSVAGVSAGGFSAGGVAGDRTPAEAAQRQAVMNWARTGVSPAANPGGDHALGSSHALGGVPEFRPFPNQTTSIPATQQDLGRALEPESTGNSAEDSTGKSTGASPSVCYLGFQVHQRYLVTQDEKGMVIIDQHALHERVLYERICKRVLHEGRPLESQQLLVPEPVSLTPAERTAALEAADTLKTIGLTIDDFGGDSIVIRSYPAMLPRTQPAEMLRTVLESLLGAGKSPDPQDLLNHLLSTIACKAAVKAGDPLSPEEITSLLEQKDLYHDTHHCPHGRPTALFFSRDELDRMFGRLGPRGRGEVRSQVAHSTQITQDTQINQGTQINHGSAASANPAP